MKTRLFSTDIHPALRATPLRGCCDDHPAMLILSKTGQHQALCSGCYLYFFWNSPQNARKIYLPAHTHPITDILPDLVKPKRRFDPWSGNPDTDKYWRRK